MIFGFFIIILLSVALTTSIRTTIISIPNLIIPLPRILYFFLDLRYYLIDWLNFNVLDNKYAINDPLFIFYNY